jgi:recombination protein RecA
MKGQLSAKDGANIDRKQSISFRAQEAAQRLTKLFGDRVVGVLSDQPSNNIEAISTGSLGLDRALGVGGLPRGRVVEIYGPEGSGKTTLTLSVIAEAQRVGALAAFVDVEHSLDPQYAQQLGVDIDSLLVAQPDSGEDALELCERLIRETGVELVIVDSVAALVPRAEIDGEMGDHHVGLQARLMSQALRKLTPVVHKRGATLVFINQVRTKIGVSFGNPETTTGGRALRFYSSVRLDIRRIGSVKSKDVVVSNRVRVKVAKNKVAPPFRQTEFEIVFGEGIDRAGELLEYALEEGLCQKSGSHYSYGELKLGHGRLKARDYLIANPSLMEELETALRLRWGLSKCDQLKAAA